MPLWFSPFPLEPTLQVRLERCGWQRCQESELPAHALVLYTSPDQLLASGELDPQGILEGYQQLLGLEHPHRLLSTWRLAACSDALLQAGCAVEADAALEWPELQGWPEPEPLAAVITRLALDALPALLEAYLDLELEADLLGSEPDSHYRRRLLSQLSFAELLQAWRSPSALAEELDMLKQEHSQALAQAQQDTTEAREEAELTLLQLHQVQEELEHYFLQSTEQAKQLETLKQEHSQALAQAHQARDEALRQAEVLQSALSQRTAERDAAAHQLETLKQEHSQALAQAQQDTTEAREEAELTLLQLHQVQEELEHYFLLSRGQAQQLERYEALLRRSEGLLSAAAR